MSTSPHPLIYLYCLVYRPVPAERPEPSAGGGATTTVRLAAGPASLPAVATAPRGLAGTRRLRALDADRGLWLVVADAPVARYDAPAIEARLGNLRWVSECAVAHEAVVEHFAGAGTVVPMKLFTLFTTEDRALEHVRRTRPALDRVLGRLRGREEWGVRVVLDAVRAARRTTSPGRRPPASGTAFLLGRKRAHEARRLLSDGARGEAERVFQTLARHADDTRRQTPAVEGGPRRVLLDAAFLVPARRLPAFQAAARAAAERLAERDIAVSLTGPWPPYNFVADAS